MDTEISIETTQKCTRVFDLTQKTRPLGSFEIGQRKKNICLNTKKISGFDAETTETEIKDRATFLLDEENEKKLLKSRPEIQGDYLGKRQEKEPEPVKMKKEKLSRKNSIFQKKLLVKDSFEAGENKVATIHRNTGLSRAFIKKTLFDLQKLGELSHSSSEASDGVVEKIRSAVITARAATGNPFFTVGSVQRTLKIRGVDASRKLITSEFKRQGLRWTTINSKKCSKQRKDLSNHKESLSASLKLLDKNLLENSDIQVLFSDEIIFNLKSIPRKRWRKIDDLKKLASRAFSRSILYCCVTCTLETIFSVQFFEKQLTSIDYLYFIYSTLELFYSKNLSKTPVIFNDQATWHRGSAIQASPIWPVLHFNTPGLYQLNYIENIFSYIKAQFRMRPFAPNLEAEINNIVRIFHKARKSILQRGFYRNHLRAIIKYSRFLEVCKKETEAAGNIDEEQ